MTGAKECNCTTPWEGEEAAPSSERKRIPLEITKQPAPANPSPSSMGRDGPGALPDQAPQLRELSAIEKRMEQSPLRGTPAEDSA
jgi:hypothetical protein